MITEDVTGTMRSLGRYTGVEVRLLYRPDDPAAVRMTITNEDGARGTWRYARSLVTDAFTTGAAGIGFVRIQRVDVMAETLLWITLVGQQHSAVLALPARPISCWLDRTERLVPPGTERVDGDWLAWQWAANISTQRILGTAGVTTTPAVPKPFGAVVWTRPGRARSRRRHGEDPADRPPRSSAARQRLARPRSKPGDDDWGDSAGSVG